MERSHSRAAYKIDDRHGLIEFPGVISRHRSPALELWKSWLDGFAKDTQLVQQHRATNYCKGHGQ